MRGNEKASYNRHNHALINAHTKVDNHPPNCIYKHDPRQMPKVQDNIAHASKKRYKKCGEDPNLDVHKKTRVMSFFEYRKCVDHANSDSGDLQGALQYPFVLNFLQKLWIRAGNLFQLKLKYMPFLAPMYGPYPMSDGSENYEKDYKATHTGLNSLLAKTKTDTYFNVSCWRNWYILMCAICTFTRKILRELHREQNEPSRDKSMRRRNY
jgi:hypothetical protein